MPALQPNQRWQTWALAAVVIVVSAHTMYARRGWDFGIYRTAGSHFLAGEPLYRADAELDYLYSPAAALAFAPFALLPQRLAYGVFTALSVLAAVRVARWSRRRTQGPPAAHLALLLVVPYLMQSINYGQVEVLWLWLLLESQERAEQPWRSGALWAAACLFKQPALIFVPVALLFGQWKRLGALAAFGAGLLGMSLLRYGSLTELFAWLAHQKAAAAVALCNHGNQSAIGIACGYWGTPDSAGFFVAAAALGAALTGLYVTAVWKCKDPGRRAFLITAFGLHLAVFLSPLGWWSNLFALTPLLYWLATLALGPAPRALRRFAGAALGVAGAASLASHHFFGAAAVEPWLPYRYYGLSGLWVGVTAAICALVLDRTATAAAPRPAAAS